MKSDEVMNFLNQISYQYPDAISLASGRPNPRFFQIEELNRYQDEFLQYYACKSKYSNKKAKKELVQYGPTSGIINKHIKNYLEIDELVNCSEKEIVITNGCQEALALICLHELKGNRDCMLVLDPSYAGFSSLLKRLSKRVETVEIDCVYNNENNSFDWSELAKKINQLKSKGLRPKAMYINPDFNNPLSYRISKKDKLILLNLCLSLNIRIIEDNPYSRFDYSRKASLTLKSLDQHNIVYHIGSFSKIFFPGVRVGYIVTPTTCKRERDDLISLKSLISINTSPITQSIVGGFLQKNNFSLADSIQPMLRGYALQRDAMLSALDKYCSNVEGMTWNYPDGGFFLVVELPFRVLQEDVEECARDYGVIFMPVSFFSMIPEKWENKIRLAFSYYDPDTIDDGIERLSKYIKSRFTSKK